jgi:hypothetical protein
MKYLGSNIFIPTAWDKTKKFIVFAFYPLCLIPYIFLLTSQPFRCIIFSFSISLLGSFILLFARWQKDNLTLLKWAIYLSFLPGLICFILSPALLMQFFYDVLQD